MGSTGNDTEGGKGSCACGETKYSFTGKPLMTAICHCHNCRKITSSAFSTALAVPSESFEFEEGSPVKTFTVKHHVEGFDMTPYFCGNCGTVICKTADDDKFRGMHIVFAGPLDESENGIVIGSVTPQVEMWTKYRLDWTPPVEGAKQCVGFT